MSRDKKIKSYAVYWRNPETRTFEKLPGAEAIVIDGKPKLIQDSSGAMIRISRA